MVLVVARPWDLHGTAHQVHIDTLARVVVARSDGVDLCTGAALIFGDEAEAILILSGIEFIGAGAREMFGKVLEAAILSGLWSK